MCKNVLCTDNRFELIEKYKSKLIESTNIETDAEDMAAIDSILFRFWQMGWLDKLDADAVPVVRCRECRWREDEQPRYSGQKVYCPAVVGGWVDGDWFCKGGERKDDEHTD